MDESTDGGNGRRHLLALVFLASFAIVVFSIFSRLGFPPLWDEHIYHLPDFLTFKVYLPHFPLSNYTASTGPLPYIIPAFIDRVIALELWGLRLLCLLCWLGAAALLYRFCRDLKLQFPVPAGLWLVSPYILAAGVTYGSVGFTLPLMVLIVAGGLLYADGRNKLLVPIIVAAVLLAWIRQGELYLVLPLVYLVLTNPHKGRRWQAVLLLLPLVAFVALACLRGELVPTPYSHNISAVWQPQPAQITLLLCLTGLLLMPLGFTCLQRMKVWSLLALLAAVWALLFPLPLGGRNHGLLVRLVTYGGELWHPLVYLVPSLLAAWGLLCLGALWQSDRKGRFLWLCLAAGMLLLINILAVWERYHYGMLLPLYLLAARSKGLHRWQVVMLVALTVALGGIMLIRLVTDNPHTLF